MTKAKEETKTPEPQPMAQSTGGLRTMKEDDVNEYLTKIMKSEQIPPHIKGLELDIMNRFRGVSQQQGNVERALTRTQVQVEQGKADLARLQGELQGYINLLVVAEDQRRSEAKE